MDAKLKKKALVLWRELAERPESLDIEAVDALTLRDEIENANLPPDERDAFEQLDRTIRLKAADTVRALQRTGAFELIQRARMELEKTNWWWWLDCRASGTLFPKAIV